ncbi:hypothetical protein B9G98_02896 [Wickerhamiella sorbophila]|uniref:Uncharacterized protein n=1 Tax=Wickerhamiella sorbophila TaxID=45607 RepID=A0A2T0FJW3_9ASCO|nr:hypothetical protein B9G98_02896 [Wickerhamiella sorbophila]PRT55276.1 hypothetical protein B9G98_02896 [Wickerhamiella sorbophila]
MDQPSFTMAERLYKKAYSASFWSQNDSKHGFDSETTTIVPHLADAPLSLRQKAHILLGVCKIISSNGRILSIEVIRTWKSMNIVKSKPKTDPLLLPARRSRSHTLPENPLINLELEKDWPPYKLPKLAYTQTPSHSISDSIRLTDFPLDQTESDYSSVTESMLSYQSDLFGNANQVLFDLTEHSDTPFNQVTPIASPVTFSEPVYPDEPIEPLDFSEPDETEDPTEARQDPSRKSKVTIQKEIFYSQDKLNEWFDGYDEFCKNASRPSKKITFERLFWGRETWSARHNRKRREAELLKKNKAAPPAMPTPDLITPDQSSDADESPHLDAFDNQFDIMDDADNSDIEFDETPGSPMLELRKGEFEHTLDTVGLLPESWDELPPHPRISGSFQRDQNELQGFLQQLTGQDALMAGRVTEEDDVAILEKVNTLGGKCLFDQVHTATRLSKGHAFFSVLRLAQQGKLSLNQPDVFGKITIQSSFRPH